MLSNAIYSKGKDDFKDYTFSAKEWSAPTTVSPDEIRNRVDSFALCGRKIKRMRLIGLSYFHTRDRVEEAAYRQVEHLPEEERQRKSNYSTIDSGMQFSRYAQIDEPILIKFEDGDIFEIETPQDPEFRMSMNCIPWWIKAGTNQPNAEADILFSPCIGQEIASVEVNTRITDKDPILFCAFDEPPYQRELVSNVTLRLGNGLGLQISPDIDYCVIPAIYHEIYGRAEPFLTVRVGEKNNCKEGLITLDGKTVIEATHKRIGWCRDHKHFFCCSDGCCGMYRVEAKQ